MIDVADSNAVYYYHYDGLGSVVALSNSSGTSIQSYEYSAFGQVAASDPNFTANPYMFTGRRFDYETGLYYYRARYYNPYIGRFLQTDPMGYGDGMNWYAYCGNNPLVFVDPSGSVQKVTGNYWTMPANLNPEMHLASVGLRESARLITNILDLAPIPGDSNDPCETIVEKYLEALEELAKLIPNIAPKNAWKCFIEVYDSDNPDKKYWIEVQGFRMEGDRSICWGPVIRGLEGYTTQRQAADAGGSLVDYARKYNKGVVPEDCPPAWKCPGYEGSPYITDKPYHASDRLLDLIIIGNTIAEKIKKIKEEIKNAPNFRGVRTTVNSL